MALSTWFCACMAPKSKSWRVNGGIHLFKKYSQAVKGFSLKQIKVKKKQPIDGLSLPFL
jgi:hypothetical protein